MITIGDRITKNYLLITITPYYNDISDKRLNEQIRSHVIQERRHIKITSADKFIISGKVFDECNCDLLELENIMSLDDAMESVPETVTCFSSNIFQPELNSLRSPKLIISCNDDHFNVPPGVRDLAIKGNDNITVYCHDNLERFVLHDGTAILTNCNNLQQLVLKDNAHYVYGEFLEYVGHLEYKHEIAFNVFTELHEYLPMFKNLHEYIGRIDKKVLNLLPFVRKIDSVCVSHNMTTDDIPDSLEDMKFCIEGVPCNDVLDEKPNIKRIKYTRQHLELDAFVEKYPNVYFYTDGYHQSLMKPIIYNNKKLVTLLELC